jgi:hypothetical protein
MNILHPLFWWGRSSVRLLILAMRRLAALVSVGNKGATWRIYTDCQIRCLKMDSTAVWGHPVRSQWLGGSYGSYYEPTPGRRFSGANHWWDRICGKVGRVLSRHEVLDGYEQGEMQSRRR